ncbi:hypothetical protein TNCT_365661 [Trichonephila clavata]|uniref:Uncharacterized protein n=1 Tax=Trichonephila clavata TaxID=2740835 RepID=A0A8X6GEH8_TRICU|nr:hypothetical protein TNCT_365661 [Trichonephila clavata]
MHKCSLRALRGWTDEKTEGGYVRKWVDGSTPFKVEDCKLGFWVFGFDFGKGHSSGPVEDVAGTAFGGDEDGDCFSFLTALTNEISQQLRFFQAILLKEKVCLCPMVLYALECWISLERNDFFFCLKASDYVQNGDFRKKRIDG